VSEFQLQVDFALIWISQGTIRMAYNGPAIKLVGVAERMEAVSRKFSSG